MNINERYQMIDLSFWYPILCRIGIKMPRTHVVFTDVELAHLLDGVTPKGFDYFVKNLICAMDDIGYPCFLRTGHMSNKHDWKNSCYITKESKIGFHITNLIEISYIVNIAGLPLPYSTWVVREIIPTKPLFYAFHGQMPIIKEARVFIRDGKVQCYHPYWPTEAFVEETNNEWGKHITELHSFAIGKIIKTANKIAQYFSGYWSIDFLQDSTGDWWVIDMALGDYSYHYPGCIKDGEKPLKPISTGAFTDSDWRTS